MIKARQSIEKIFAEAVCILVQARKNHIDDLTVVATEVSNAMCEGPSLRNAVVRRHVILVMTPQSRMPLSAVREVPV